MTAKLKLLSLCSGLALLGACATNTAAPSPTYASAVKHNISVHAVPPTDAQKQNTFIPADRDRKALAKKRYEADEVEKPTPVNTR